MTAAVGAGTAAMLLLAPSTAASPVHDGSGPAIAGDGTNDAVPIMAAANAASVSCRIPSDGFFETMVFPLPGRDAPLTHCRTCAPSCARWDSEIQTREIFGSCRRDLRVRRLPSQRLLCGQP